MVQHLQAVLEEMARAEHLRFDGSHRQAERLGDLLVRKVLEVAQDQDEVWLGFAQF